MIYPRKNNPPLRKITPRSIQSVQSSGIPVSGLFIRVNAQVAISITAKTRRSETASHAIGSVFP